MNIDKANKEYIIEVVEDNFKNSLKNIAKLHDKKSCGDSITFDDVRKAESQSVVSALKNDDYKTEHLKNELKDNKYTDYDKFTKYYYSNDSDKNITNYEPVYKSKINNKEIYLKTGFRDLNPSTVEASIKMKTLGFSVPNMTYIPRYNLGTKEINIATDIICTDSANSIIKKDYIKKDIGTDLETSLYKTTERLILEFETGISDNKTINVYNVEKIDGKNKEVFFDPLMNDVKHFAYIYRHFCEYLRDNKETFEGVIEYNDDDGDVATAHTITLAKILNKNGNKKLFEIRALELFYEFILIQSRKATKESIIEYRKMQGIKDNNDQKIEEKFKIIKSLKDKEPDEITYSDLVRLGMASGIIDSVSLNASSFFSCEEAKDEFVKFLKTRRLEALKEKIKEVKNINNDKAINDLANQKINKTMEKRKYFYERNQHLKDEKGNLYPKQTEIETRNKKYFLKLAQEADRKIDASKTVNSYHPAIENNSYNNSDKNIEENYLKGVDSTLYKPSIIKNLAGKIQIKDNNTEAYKNRILCNFGKLEPITYQKQHTNRLENENENNFEISKRHLSFLLRWEIEAVFYSGIEEDSKKNSYFNTFFCFKNEEDYQREGVILLNMRENTEDFFEDKLRLSKEVDRMLECLKNKKEYILNDNAFLEEKNKEKSKKVFLLVYNAYNNNKQKPITITSLYKEKEKIDDNFFSFDKKYLTNIVDGKSDEEKLKLAKMKVQNNIVDTLINLSNENNISYKELCSIILIAIKNEGCRNIKNENSEAKLAIKISALFQKKMKEKGIYTGRLTGNLNNEVGLRMKRLPESIIELLRDKKDDFIAKDKDFKSTNILNKDLSNRMNFILER